MAGPAVEPEGASATSPGSRAPDTILKGVLLMLAATLVIALMHAAIRHASNGMHAFEIAFFRNVFGLLVVLPWFLRQGLGPLRTRRLPMHLLRAAFTIAAMLSFFYAISITPLAQVTALAFTAPIFATILAVPVFGERVRLRRSSAIVLGFLGTLIILRPGLAEIGLGQLLTIASSFAWACALLTIKSLGRTDSSITIIAYMSLLMIPASLIPALFVWQWPDLPQLGWLLVIGLLGNIGQLCVTEALKHGETSVIMPVEFCRLIWVAAIAYVAFGEVPDLYTWIGGTVIFASTVDIAYRERQLGPVRPA